MPGIKAFHGFLSFSAVAVFFLILFGPPIQSPSAGDETDKYAPARAKMVLEQIESRGVSDPRVLRAMKAVPRHLFVPRKLKRVAYGDHPLPIGEGQTISQPYIVALMTQLLDLKPSDRVLEIGTGSGYQAAVLAEVGCDVFSVEIIKSLGERARKTLKRLGYENVHVKIADGYKGWPEQGPFDAVIVTCAPEKIPQTLVEQLKAGGRLIVPVGQAGGIQQLVRGVKKGNQMDFESVLPVRFVPMVKKSL
jgi:protein-L-isoaspartate(D-aspartate) O-methyltransferase